MSEPGRETVDVKKSVEIYTDFFTEKLINQIKELRAGRRECVRHGGKLCSWCMDMLPTGSKGGYCRPCRAADMRRRRAAARHGEQQ